MRRWWQVTGTKLFKYRGVFHKLGLHGIGGGYYQGPIDPDDPKLIQETLEDLCDAKSIEFLFAEGHEF